MEMNEHRIILARWSGMEKKNTLGVWWSCYPNVAFLYGIERSKKKKKKQEK